MTVRLTTLVAAQLFPSSHTSLSAQKTQKQLVNASLLIIALRHESFPVPTDEKYSDAVFADFV
jgi:hypothetical protein